MHKHEAPEWPERAGTVPCRFLARPLTSRPCGGRIVGLVCVGLPPTRLGFNSRPPHIFLTPSVVLEPLP